MGERPPFPTERDVLDARLEQQALETHVGRPGRVLRYDAATQTADVVPLVRHPVPQPDGSYEFEELPVIPSVPVLWPRVGAWFFALKVEAGDTVQLLFNDCDLGTWRTGDGSVVTPGDLRRHHLSHAVAIPGLYTRGRALAHAPSGDVALVLGSDEGTARVSFRTDGTIELHAGTQAFLRGDDHTRDLGTFLDALEAAETALAAALGAVNTWALVVQPVGDPTGTATTTLTTALTTTLSAAMTLFSTAKATFRTSLTTHLSRKIKGE